MAVVVVLMSGMVLPVEEVVASMAALMSAVVAPMAPEDKVMSETGALPTTDRLSASLNDNDDNLGVTFGSGKISVT